ncbi:MAG TPA: DUF927 domain-containing protein [Holophaga sp.]|nr:DUF927 domain-containing protein [Holophaga sp.]
MTFQTFDDVKPGGKARGELARMIHGPLAAVARDLEAVNRMGAGIFVAVCETDGRGRKKPNITAARAWWCDVDEKGARESLDIARLPLAPSMVVKTPGGLHLYWLAEAPMLLRDDARRAAHEEEVRAIAAALEAFGGDLKACDVARVLRVPGFLHQKSEPRPVVLDHADGPRYTREQIRTAFPIQQKSEQAIGGRSSPMDRPAPSSRDGILRRAERYLDSLPPAIAGQAGHQATFDAALKTITGFDLCQEEALVLMQDRYNPRCVPPWALDELKHKVTDAWNIAQRSANRGHLLDESHNRNRESNAWAGPKAPPQHVEQGQVHEQAPEPAPEEESKPPEVPGFRWREAGLFQAKLKPSKDGEEPEAEETWIAPRFWLPGLVRDEDSHGWRLLIAWRDLDGIQHEEGIPFDLLSGEGVELARMLGQGGLLIHPDIGRRKALLRYLSAAAPKVGRRVRLVDALGWHDGAFVLPNGECIGRSAEPLRFGGDPAGGAMQGRHGTLEGWKQNVARLAVGNPRLAFALACAFAGPLLEIIRPDGGGGFNLMGQSTRGKSTCLETAASVWGRPSPLPTWRATDNGLEGIAAARNDGFLALDEMSQADAQTVGRVAYMLANGSAKARAGKSGESRHLKQWRLVFLSSGEVGLEDRLNEDGKRLRAGQEVRVPDVPCPEGGMFENAHGLPGFGALAEHLKAHARKDYGQAARIFLANLSREWERLESLRTKLQEMERAWLNSAVPHGADGQVARVAGRFAVVAVAGELATTMGILPWPEGEASRAALVCFHAWLERRGHIGASERERGLQAVVDFLNTHGLARFAEWNNPEARPVNMAGVRKASEEITADGKSCGWDFFITPTGWKEACKGFDVRAVARDAMEEKLLEAGQKERAYQKRKTPHGEGRFYVVRAQALGMFRTGETS